MLKILSRKTNSFLNHLRKGTVRQRIQIILHQWLTDNFWLNYPSRRNSFVHTLSEGIQINLYRDDRLSELIYKSDFEANERAFVCNYLKPDMVFIDVGANIGLYSLIAAKMIRPDGIVYAFEPASKTFQRLLNNIRLNGFENIKTIQAALSDQDEFRDLITYSRMYNAWNSLGGQIVNSQRVHKEQVECMRLDTLIAKNNLLGLVNLMKVDVEGWEYYVLKGGANFLQSPDSPDLLVEFSDANMATTGTSATDIYNLLQSYGYNIFGIDSTYKRLISEQFANNHPYNNYFLTKNLDRAQKLTGYGHEIQ